MRLEAMSELEEELLALFGRGVDAPLPEAAFNRLSLAAFRRQWERNRPYGAFCRARGRSPDTVADWRDVPALPTAAFKAADLTTVPPEEVRVVYHTSGTSRGGRPGRHLLPDTRLYDAALEPNFRAHLLPDVAQMRMLVCGPTAEFFPQSSLGHMHSRVLECFGSAGSGAFWRVDGPRFPCLAAALGKAEREVTAVCLLGTAFGFVNFLDWLAGENRTFRLPPGSRIMDTGGYKGRSREVPKEELYSLYGARLGVPLTHVVNEYGMTEMGSQFYDHVLRQTVQSPKSKVQGPEIEMPVSAANDFGQDSTVSGAGMERSTLAGPASTTLDFGLWTLDQRRKTPPPWVRTQVVDPETLAPLPEGAVGLLRHFDLANLHTVSAIQTDDLGVWRGDGFEVLGRAAGAEPRGCSLAVEELGESV